MSRLIVKDNACQQQPQKSMERQEASTSELCETDEDDESQAIVVLLIYASIRLPFALGEVGPPDQGFSK